MIDQKFEALEPKWNDTLYLICEKCGFKISPDGNLAAKIKDEFKKELVNMKKWGPIRVSVSSCLGTCPENKITIAKIDLKNDSKKSEIFTIKSEDSTPFIQQMKPQI